jgi:ATP-dependent 26S proteasome regulatory subunit
METPPYDSSSDINDNFSNQMNGMMKFRLINNALSYLNIKTGNKNIDLFFSSIFQAIIFSYMTHLFSNISYVTKKIQILMLPLILYSNNQFNLLWLYINNKPKLFEKKVDIMYITENKQVNELYKAVFWYLSNTNDIDYINETYLQYTCDQKSLMSGSCEINKIINQNKEKKIKYKNTEITYSYYTDIITVYTDKDRKKENYVVTLKTIQHENSNEDILEEFCKFCGNEYKEYLTGKVWTQQIYTNNRYEWKNSASNNYRKLDTIILKNDLRNTIKNDIQLFLNSEEWYQHRDIPYTRGYLFYGHPGTGKTSMIKGLSLFSKRHIHYLMLNEVETDTQLVELVKSINYKDTILVIEDIDAMLNVVKSRTMEQKSYEEFMNEKDKDKKMTKEEWEQYNETKNKRSTITLSGLLNVIDGLFSSHGRILIMTTNHPEILDSALIRPGRIDCKFLFDNCNREQIGRLYEMFFNKELSELNKYQLKQIIKEYSPAEITSIFLRYRNNPNSALLYLYQDEEENETKEENKNYECSGNDCYDGINVPAIYALTNS